MDWIHLAQYGNHWWDLVNTAIKILILWNLRNFLTSNSELLKASDSPSCFISLLLPKNICNKAILPPALLLPAGKDFAVPGAHLCLTCAHVALYWVNASPRCIKEEMHIDIESKMAPGFFFHRAFFKECIILYLPLLFCLNMKKCNYIYGKKGCVCSIRYEFSLLSFC